jgi:carboxylesterase
MGNRTGCLIIHGFGGNINEVKPLANFMKDKGFITYCPTLKGHIGDKKSLSSVSYKDWIESADNGLKYLLPKCDRVVVIGFSMGGLIGVHLATKYNIHALATLSSPIYYWDIKRMFLNILQDIKTKNFTNLKRYRSTGNKLPFSALVNFRIILSKTKPLFKRVKCPLFIAQGLLETLLTIEVQNIFILIPGQKLKKSSTIRILPTKYASVLIEIYFLKTFTSL